MSSNHNESVITLIKFPGSLEELGKGVVYFNALRTGKSTISRMIQYKVIQDQITKREQINYSVADPSTVSKDLIIRIKLSNWFVKNYPNLKIEGIVRLYGESIRKNTPSRKSNILNQSDIFNLFDVNQTFTLRHYAEPTRAFNIIKLD